jgi:site-specific DNA recombinase
VRSIPAAEVEKRWSRRTCYKRPRSLRGRGRQRGRKRVSRTRGRQDDIDFAPLWDELFPAEQARIVRLLVERVDLTPDGMRVRLRAEGLQTLVGELQSREAEAA